MRGLFRPSLSRLTSHLLPVVAGLVACRGSLSPLSNHIAVGQEPYAVFVADGENDVGDLFAVPAAGGTVFQVTFTRVGESGPALSPDGVVLVFARSRSSADTTRRSVWVLNLLSGAERELFTAPEPGALRIGWGPRGDVLYLRTPSQTYRIAPPPAAPDARPVTTDEQAAADSALSVILGEPGFARVVRCESGSASSGGEGMLCVATAHGGTQPLVRAAHDPARWGPDSVAYFVGPELTVRPLGGGITRRLRWTKVPVKPREVTFFEGAQER